jgi:hypothetical protein
MTAADQNVLKANHAQKEYEPQARSTLVPAHEISVVERCLLQGVRVRKMAQVTENL